MASGSKIIYHDTSNDHKMVYGVGNSKFLIVKMWNIDVLVKIGDTWHMSKLKDVLHVSKFGRNFSWS
jgi:hypothetical protein